MKPQLLSFAFAAATLAIVPAMSGPAAAQSCPAGTNYVGQWVEHTSDTDITHIQCQQTVAPPSLPMTREAPIAPGQPIFTPRESEECSIAEEQFRAWDSAKHLAQLANDVYSADNTGPNAVPGFTRISDDVKAMHALFPFSSEDQIRALFNAGSPAYRAAIYQDQTSKKYYVVFRGTQSIPDWGANVGQATGLGSQYYEHAIQLAQMMKRAVGAANFETVGHSLGGGLAIAAALAAGSGATTYNPAGVRASTVASPGATDAYGITNYIVDGEPLTFTQHNQSGLSQSGLPASNPKQIMPPAVGHNVIMPVDWAGAPMPGSINRHRMGPGVLPAISEEWANARRALLGLKCGGGT